MLLWFRNKLGLALLVITVPASTQQDIIVANEMERYTFNMGAFAARSKSLG